MTLEHFGWISPDENPHYKSTSWNQREDDYASVAFWYQTGESTFAARAPHARQRRLPSIERLTVRAADFLDARYHGVGSVAGQQLDLYEGKQLLYMPKQADDAWIEIPFDGAEEGAAAAAAECDQELRFRQSTRRR